MRRPSKFVCVAVLVTLAIFLAASLATAADLVYVPLDHWSYDAFTRLATLGLMPLHAVSARPITRLEARQLVQEATVRISALDPRWTRLARDDLRRLADEFLVPSPAAVTVGLTADGRSSDFVPNRSPGTSSLAISFASPENWQIYWRGVLGGQLQGSSTVEAYASFQLGTVFVQAGRSAVAWGPSLRSGMLLSDNAGGFPMLRLAAKLPRVRFTKTVASLERTGGAPSGDVVVFATRLDWMVTPTFRLGLSESVVKGWGGPLTLYHLIQPLPVFSGIVASYDLHDALGQTRNMSIEVDFDWVPRAGLRLYGSFLIDDAPERISERRAKIGVLGGVYLLDPFRTGRTSLRLEYSAVANGTYSYPIGLEHAYFGRSLGNWLGPDGDDLYLELTHRLSEAADLQLSFAYTRHGEGRIGQVSPPPEQWFLSGVVEHRQTFGVQFHRIHSLSLETRYRAEIAHVQNRANVAGENGWEGLLSAQLTYRWPVEPRGSRVAVPAPPSLPSPVDTPALPEPGLAGYYPRLQLQSWPATVTSRGSLSGPSSTSAYRGVAYRFGWMSTMVSFAFDASADGSSSFWSADWHYPIARFEHGAISIFAGWGGFRYRGQLGGTTQTFSLSTPRLGGAFSYRLSLNNMKTPIYFMGELASPPLRAILAPREGGAPFYLWTYKLGAEWRPNSGLSLEAGYRGVAALWRVGTPDATTLNWSGFYVSASWQ